MISPLFDERWTAYTETVVRIDHPTIGRIVVTPEPSGRTQGLFPHESGRPIHVMTAHNPGRALSARENEQRQRQLLAGLEQQGDLEIWDAVGADVSWTHQEQSLAIIGLTDDDAREVARTFDQDAIFAWTPARWNLLSCIDDRTWHAGWTLTPERAA